MSKHSYICGRGTVIFPTSGLAEEILQSSSRRGQNLVCQGGGHRRCLPFVGEGWGYPWRLSAAVGHHFRRPATTVAYGLTLTGPNPPL